MPQVTSAFASLLPAAGAIALIAQGIGRKARSRSGEPSRPITQPKEPVAPPSSRARRAPLPDVACAACGTSIPAGTTHCAPCARAAAGPDATLSSTALNWLFLVGILAAVIGAGWLLSP
jgi:hypothetical protein